jgi:cob(I)alamin adenosyltransferase
MRITRVYTRNGDKGFTRLVGGQKVQKNHVRIAAFGEIDELNSVLGQVRDQIREHLPNLPALAPCDTLLFEIQNDLFRAGADLATEPDDRWEGMERLTNQDTEKLEKACDTYNGSLEPLKEFILPGGGPVSCWLHTARTTCRRVERSLVELESHSEGSTETVLPYINRLSDLFFVLSRWTAHTMGYPETLWQRRP